MFDKSAENFKNEKNLHIMGSTGGFFIDQEYLQMKSEMAKKYRILEMDEVFTVESCYKLRYYLENFLREDKQKANGDNEKFKRIVADNPITIRINSPGGYVFCLSGVLNVMKKMQEIGYIIKTHGVGMSASCASILLMAGTKGYRTMGKYSTVLIHQASYMTGGTHSYNKAQIEFSEKQEELINSVIYENTNIDKETLEKHTLGADWELMSDEALFYNIIDQIV
jgi:ATP-dependent protease ClpP protease subunit